ncbi:MAG: glycine--tRNA ligase [Candidatus Komeilibacteria bacterium RIFCSPLOWO2_02_FULL_48_11]|uniref:Glycine--tRNA ligase n=1 Tax=Candidatus Komeilibacteria bacterium RIFCSPLOWO2_02_FULL_48_11 TaxID=1798553 RepID=A0A1G2BR80_9BACT|nr:MAG: glycine--tRNA ligase [Candidatus Komeilibacteria bacterium RIFCSPLOWO2_02_FULL_48_11]
MQKNTQTMDKIISLCKQRGFIYPGSEIYGGLANSWDYGPLGVELKNNIKQRWWKRFVQDRDDMVGLDAALIMNPRVWAASGHLSNFSDPLVECKKCHMRFREDDDGIAAVASTLPRNDRSESVIASEAKPARSWPPFGRQSRNQKHCPQCGGELTQPKQFNLMFKTFIGPAEESADVVYLRPEIAQAMFVNFANVLRTTRKRLPFGIASQGKAFRNEITPGNFIFRTREFDLMEFEYFIDEKDWKKWFEYWQKEMKDWITKDLGLNPKKVHEVEVPKEDRAHYSKRTIDFEYEYPFGQKELYGLAYRADFDLKNHMKISGQDLQYTDTESGEKFVPHVIEPTFGADRSVLAAMVEAYHEEEVDGETRAVLKLPKWLAPIKVAILPLSKKDELAKAARPIYDELRQYFVCEYDETQSIGKRYRRQDEIGTPYCVTVDFESLDDKMVTVRERDSMKQERVGIKELHNYLVDKLV